MKIKIFVSYNPNVEIEQSTALRLQTLSSLYGAIVYLPDRLGSQKLKSSTRQNIDDANVFVMFSTENLSSVVREEVEYALSKNKRVVIFYDKQTGKNLNTSNIQNPNLYETRFDPQNDDTVNILQQVLKHGGFVPAGTPVEMAKNKNKGISALVGVGLGLLLMWGISKLASDDDDES